MIKYLGLRALELVAELSKHCGWRWRRPQKRRGAELLAKGLLPLCQLKLALRVICGPTEPSQELVCSSLSLSCLSLTRPQATAPVLPKT